MAWPRRPAAAAGGWRWAGAAVLVGGQGVGKEYQGARGSISLAHFGLEWSREAGRREAGAPAELICCGSAGAWEEVWLVVMAVAELGGGAGVPL